MTEPAPTPQLNKALSQLQGELPRIKKTKTAEVKDQQGNRVLYTYDYADLGDVVADVGPLMAKFGLAFHCSPTINPADRREMVMLWSLLHESGEEKAGEWPLGPVNQKPQSLGSAITYGRRYCFTAATNIVLEDDDDGQRAQQDHGGAQSAGDAWQKSTPARPRQDSGESNGHAATTAGGQPWYEHAIKRADAFKNEPEGFKLYHEAASVHLAGDCTKDQQDHVQSRVMVRIKARRKEAAARILKSLGEDDPWRVKILEELASDEDARGEREEVGRLKAAGTMDDARASLLDRAIIAAFPKSALNGRETAA